MTNIYLEDTIVNQSRHQFLYGYNTEERTKFLKDIATNNSLVIYIDDLGFSKEENNNLDDIKQIRLIHITKMYQYTNIIIKLIEKILSETNISREKELNFLDTVNTLFLNKNIEPLASLSSFLDILNKDKDKYKVFYENILNDIEVDISIINTCIYNLEPLVKYINKMINNNSYIIIIFNHIKEISLLSTKSINSLVGSRINKNIKVLVSTDNESWRTYYDLSGNYVQSIHDYETLSFDSNTKDYIRRLKKLHENDS